MSTMTHNTRSERRADTEIRGQVKLGAFLTIQCTVTDLSVGGAKLLLEKPAKKIPKRFSLTLHSDHQPKKRTCVCRWQEDELLGVEFHYS
ncbi:MAG: PilZ domain-containing protein [Pseudomonadota bacterium]